MDGVSLISPKGWKISDEHNVYGQGYFLSIVKDGWNSSGVMWLSWFVSELDLTELINNQKDVIKNNILYKNSNLIFGDEIENKFNDLTTISIAFNFSLIGLKHEGIIHVFYEKEKTFILLMQEVVEDKVKNETGFELIERSFKIE